jgi:hypothetical protein
VIPSTRISSSGAAACLHIVLLVWCLGVVVFLICLLCSEKYGVESYLVEVCELNRGRDFVRNNTRIAYAVTTLIACTAIPLTQLCQSRISSYAVFHLYPLLTNRDVYVSAVFNLCTRGKKSPFRTSISPFAGDKSVIASETNFLALVLCFVALLVFYVYCKAQYYILPTVCLYGSYACSNK